jgi:hypothetical protein
LIVLARKKSPRRATVTVISVYSLCLMPCYICNLDGNSVFTCALSVVHTNLLNLEQCSRNNENGGDCCSDVTTSAPVWLVTSDTYIAKQNKHLRTCIITVEVVLVRDLNHELDTRELEMGLGSRMSFDLDLHEKRVQLDLRENTDLREDIPTSVLRLDDKGQVVLERRRLTSSEVRYYVIENVNQRLNN